MSLTKDGRNWVLFYRTDALSVPTIHVPGMVTNDKGDAFTLGDSIHFLCYTLPQNHSGDVDMGTKSTRDARRSRLAAENRRKSASIRGNLRGILRNANERHDEEIPELPAQIRLVLARHRPYRRAGRR